MHRCTNIWNSLPKCVVEAESVESFEYHLDKHWRNQPFVYNSEEIGPVVEGSVAGDADLELTLEATPGLQSENIPECILC